MAKKLHPILVILLSLTFLPSCQKDDNSQPIDYALQIIPDINKIIPKELLRSFGEENLHFGDNPPILGEYFPYDHTGTCFFCDSLRLTKFIHNTDIDPDSEYSQENLSWVPSPYYFIIRDQHKGIAEFYSYERVCLDEHWGPVQHYLSEYAKEYDYVFIMGEGDLFTIYLKQQRKYHAINVNAVPSSLVVGESILISGKVTDTGIEDFHLATRIEDYNQNYSMIGAGGGNGLPQVHDIFVYDYPKGKLRYNANYYQNEL